MNFKSDKSFSSYSSRSLNKNEDDNFSQFQVDKTENSFNFVPKQYQQSHIQKQRRSYSNKSKNNYQKQVYKYQMTPILSHVNQLCYSHFPLRAQFQQNYLEKRSYMHNQRLNILKQAMNIQDYNLNAINALNYKSEFWNGYKFDYLGQNKNNHMSVQVKQKKPKVKGVIINKGQSLPKTQQYIKIQQSNQLSQKKLINVQNCISQQLIQRLEAQQNKNTQNCQYTQKQSQQIKRRSSQNKQVCSNIDKTQNQPNITQRILIKDLRINDTLIVQKIKQQNANLKRQNQNLQIMLKQKHLQIQHLMQKRFKQNDQYSEKIQQLKVIFKRQKQNDKNLFQNQVQKLHREYNRQINLIRSLKSQSNSSQNNLITHYQTKIQQLQSMVKSSQSQIKELKIIIQGKSKNEKKQNWQNNFIRVFADMIRKLPDQIKIHKQWSQKKLVVVGWQIVKAIIQKYLKVGIKFPHFVYQNQQNLV